MKDNNIKNTENIEEIKGLKKEMKKVSGGTESIYPPGSIPRPDGKDLILNNHDPFRQLTVKPLARPEESLRP